MQMWDKDYFNMEVQAFIRIEQNHKGNFQFGLVSGALDGRIVNYHDGDKFEFNWEGYDECDSESGSGWIRIKDEDTLEGEFRLYNGDNSTFLAKRVE